jgi:hypothetical protein
VSSKDHSIDRVIGKVRMAASMGLVFAFLGSFVGMVPASAGAAVAEIEEIGLIFGLALGAVIAFAKKT